ncbi:MAG: aminotransferase class V-fold PLP-dependent enzyme [Dehalococcoidia bacterium]
MDTTTIREAIPVTSNIIYMNTGWSGPSPTRVTRRIQELLEQEMTGGPATPETTARNRAIHDELTSCVAGLLNAPPETIAPTQSTTHGLTIVVNGIDWRQDDELVTCSLEHPSVMLPSLLLQKSHGVKVRIAKLDPKDDRETILSKIEGCISQRTRLVFMSHIQFSSGLRLPAREIAQLAHRQGAYLLLDGAQGGGQIALDMEAMDCDFYSIPGQKWLLGPDGTGALYLRKELISEISPRYPAHGAVEDWDRDTGEMTLNSESPRKYRLSTTSTPLEAGLIQAIAFHQEIGSTAVEARTMELAASLRTVLAEVAGISLTGPDDPELSSGLVTFAVAGKEPRQVVDALWERGISCRPVPNPEGIRLCTAFFNTEEEIQRVGQALGEMAGN